MTKNARFEGSNLAGGFIRSNDAEHVSFFDVGTIRFTPFEKGDLVCHGDYCTAADAAKAKRYVVAPAGGEGGESPESDAANTDFFDLRCIMTHSVGIKKTPRIVPPSIPPNTAVPMDCRAAAPAPLATTNGTTPRINAKEVIRIGRKRSFAASTAASVTVFPPARSSRANSTIRIAFLAARPTSKTSPT